MATTTESRAMWARASLLLGSTLLVGIFSISLITSLGFLLRFSVSAYVLLGASVVGALWTSYGARQCFDRSAALVCALLIAAVALICIISAVASQQFYDLSADGQTYHQRAIALLAQGWNPVQETSRTDDQRVDHYVFGSWLPPATLYRLTGQLEQAKLFNTILALSAFLIAAGVFLATADLIAWQAILVAVAVTLNPVIVTQTLSFMVDGQVASLITIIACSSIAVVDQPRAKVSWIVLYAAVGLLIAAKLSGLVYGILLLGALLIWFGLYQRPYVLTLAYGSVTTLAIGVFVMGTPLISNTVHIGHPFFPAIRTPQPEWPDAP